MTRPGRRGYMVGADAAASAAVGIEADADTDSDPEMETGPTRGRIRRWVALESVVNFTQEQSGPSRSIRPRVPDTRYRFVP